MFRIIKRSRFNYWNNNKFADLLRGTPKPLALEWDAWEKWHDDAKQSHPCRYWLAENLLRNIQNIVSWPLDAIHTIRVYTRNRFIDKTHYLKTGLKAGTYYDLDERILYGLFNELVDLVEIEYAHLSKWNENKKYKFVRGRCIEAGIDYLNWASALRYSVKDGLLKEDKLIGEPTPQAKAATKVLELYNWWKNRPNRPDPHTVFTKEAYGKKYYLKIHKMEKDLYQEDNKMLIELIKIRDHLWT
jgi:hypothetical protein